MQTRVRVHGFPTFGIGADRKQQSGVVELPCPLHLIAGNVKFQLRSRGRYADRGINIESPACVVACVNKLRRHAKRDACRAESIKAQHRHTVFCLTHGEGHAGEGSVQRNRRNIARHAFRQVLESQLYLDRQICVDSLIIFSKAELQHIRSEQQIILFQPQVALKGCYDIVLFIGEQDESIFERNLVGLVIQARPIQCRRDVFRKLFPSVIDDSRLHIPEVKRPVQSPDERRVSSGLGFDFCVLLIPVGGVRFNRFVWCGALVFNIAGRYLQDCFCLRWNERAVCIKPRFPGRSCFRLNRH